MAKRKKRLKRGSIEAPMHSCLLLCDDVFQSTLRNKHTLQGVIGGIRVRQLPTIIGPHVAYIRWSNVYKDQDLHLMLSAPDGEEVFGFDAKSPPTSNPLDTHTLIVKIPLFEIKLAGRYVFSALHAGVAFAQTTIEVRGPQSEET